MNNEQPLFTIATITYNSSQWVRQTIESILCSTFTDFELLISDDCSTDNTWEIVKDYSDVRIRSWRNENNIGEYPNRNKVLNEARGKYILFIDGDDILYKDGLQEYSNYLSAFPSASAIWGVFSVYFDFIVFPYQFTPYQLSRINFFSTYPVTVVGFSDSVFNVNDLKKIGGFDERFAVGDTFIKRKFACFYDVVLIPAGRAFWRQYPSQASNKVRSYYKNLMETYTIDKEILDSTYHPFSSDELGVAKANLRIRTIKLIFKNTIQKAKFFDFFILMRKLSISFLDMRLLFKKGNYAYKAEASGVNPLMNNYHFIRKENLHA